MSNSTNYHHVPMYFRGKMLKEIHTLKLKGYSNDKITIFFIKKGYKHATVEKMIIDSDLVYGAKQP